LLPGHVQRAGATRMVAPVGKDPSNQTCAASIDLCGSVRHALEEGEHTEPPSNKEKSLVVLLFFFKDINQYTADRGAGSLSFLSCAIDPQKPNKPHNLEAADDVHLIGVLLIFEPDQSRTYRVLVPVLAPRSSQDWP
jgi:hypothetical protein